MTVDLTKEADRWFYDLGLLAKVVEANDKRSIAAREEADAAQRKANDARKRMWAIAGFVLFAFLLLAWRNEVAAGRVEDNADRITMTQRATCQSGLEILLKFNRQQDQLIAAERANTGGDAAVREARIRAFEEGRIQPLPICETAPERKR